MRVIVVGGSYLGVAVASIIERIDGLDFAGFVDDAPENVHPEYRRHIIGATDMLGNGFAAGAGILIAIGKNCDRIRILERVKSLGMENALMSLVDPSSTVLEGSTIGRGSIVFPGSVIGPNAHIGECSIVGANATIGAFTSIGSVSNVSPGVNIGSGVCVGASVHVGIGAAIMQCLKIHANATVGAGAVVVRNIERPGTFLGIPARMPNHRE
jgi:sugar O-acyltransferase (sialic acid O-acetyltransferase NeuD family)